MTETVFVIDHLNTLPLAQALWWYIENISSDDPRASKLFFYLRERYNKEVQT